MQRMIIANLYIILTAPFSLVGKLITRCPLMRSTFCNTKYRISQRGVIGTLFNEFAVSSLTWYISMNLSAQIKIIKQNWQYDMAVNSMGPISMSIHLMVTNTVVSIVSLHVGALSDCITTLTETIWSQTIIIVTPISHKPIFQFLIPVILRKT